MKAECLTLLGRLETMVPAAVLAGGLDLGQSRFTTSLGEVLLTETEAWPVPHKLKNVILLHPDQHLM